MATRRKTWVGDGLFAIAGTALPSAATTTLAATDALTAGHSDRAGTPTPPAARPILLAEGGEAGGEGGGAPETYSLLSTDPNAFKYEAEDEIAAYANGVHASYAAAVDRAKAMARAVDAMLADPNDRTVAAARAAWVEARPAYDLTEAFRFYDGPIEALEGEINSWPVNEAFIDYVEGDPQAGIINDPAKPMSISELILNNKRSDETDVTLGWHAVEFLLWGQDLSADGPGSRPASEYIAGQGNNDRRRAYLKVAADRLVADLNRVAAAWAPGVSDNYAAMFRALPEREAIGRIMNGIAILAGAEMMSERLAVGLDSGDQEDEQSCFSDTTHQDFVYDIKGIENVWTGTFPGANGPGMRDLAVKVDAGLAADVDGLLTDAIAKIAALGDPWDRVLASPEGSPARAAGEATVTALQKLADGLKRAGNKLGVLVQIPTD